MTRAVKPLARNRCATATNYGLDRRVDRGEPNADAGQYLGHHTVALHHSEQDVFCADAVVVQPPRLVLGQCHGIAGSIGELVEREVRTVTWARTGGNPPDLPKPMD